VVDVYSELKEFGLDVEIYDPLANKDQVQREYGIELQENLNLEHYPVILLAVAHDEFKTLKIQTAPDKVIYDLKGVLPREVVDKRL